MKVVSEVFKMKKEIEEVKGLGKTISFVPTMGYLHKGHISLIKKAKSMADFVVLSIFVNPTQFSPGEDLDKYPRDFNRDEKIAIENGVDIIFYPDINEIYPKGYSSFVEVEGINNFLCGKSRPSHFRGVATIVLKLFNITKADKAVFGLKDAQQIRVIEQMVKDFDLDIKIIRSEIIREADGLAMSSRNKYLDKTQRENAISLKRSLDIGKDLIVSGETNIDLIINKMTKCINSYKNVKIDYFEILNFNDFSSKDIFEKEIIIAGAVFIGNTRLIDNIIINVEEMKEQ